MFTITGALVQCQVYPMRRDILILRQPEQFPQRVLGFRGTLTDDTEGLATPMHLDIQPVFDQSQILIQWATQFCQPQVVGWFELKLTLHRVP